MSEILEWEAAERIGEKVLDAVDRLKDVDAAMPGSQAHWKFHVDGIEFECVIRVADRGSLTNPKADT